MKFTPPQQSSQVDSQTQLIGKDRNRVYYGYFEDPKVLQWFHHILELDSLEQRRKDVEQKGFCEQLGIGDGNGNLTNFLEQSLQKEGLKIYTTSTDISQDQISGNMNNGVTKKVLDISTQNPSLIFNKRFDLISTRSVFHYMGNIVTIENSLWHIQSSLSKEGVYILQEVTCENEIEINLIKSIFGLVGKPVVFLTHEVFKHKINEYFSIEESHSGRYYQMSLKNSELYRNIDINFTKNELFKIFKNGNSSITDQGPGLFVEQEEFLKRYNDLYSPKDGQELLLKNEIIQLIEQVPKEQRPNIILKDGKFGIHFHYTTLICSHK